jgi:hypothetical protein
VCCLVGQHGAAHRDGEHGVPVLDADLVGQTAALDGGGVGEGIESTEGLDRCGEGAVDALLVGDVDVQVGGLSGSVRTGRVRDSRPSSSSTSMPTTLAPALT